MKTVETIAKIVVAICSIGLAAIAGFVIYVFLVAAITGSNPFQ
jgi:hypothetical protein